MFATPLRHDFERVYSNSGQHAEQVFIYTMTGLLLKASNVPATKAGDFEDIQIKSARATVCKGTDIKAHVQQDAANRYAYVTADFETAYIMSPSEWIDFVTEFGTVTRESKANGGATKTRLKAESKVLRAWLSSRA